MKLKQIPIVFSLLLLGYSASATPNGPHNDDNPIRPFLMQPSSLETISKLINQKGFRICDRGDNCVSKRRILGAIGQSIACEGYGKWTTASIYEREIPGEEDSSGAPAYHYLTIGVDVNHQPWQISIIKGSTKRSFSDKFNDWICGGC